MGAPSLTSRDLDVLEFLIEHKAAPLDVLAEQFFHRNPQTGKVNSNPMAACTRRLTHLSKEGYIDLESGRERGNEERTRIARPTAKTMKECRGTGTVYRVHGRARDHHLASLRAVLALQTRLQARGYKVEDVMLDHAIRAKAQKGATPQLGDTFESFPDGALVAVSANGDRSAIAVEYVTSKYSDNDIISKARSFERSYDRVEWVADTVATAKRITRLTGHPAIAK